jgi:glycosyltransferase involved in cell wall biosynthesis
MKVAYLSTDPGIVSGATKGAAVHVEELSRAIAGERTKVLLLVSSRDPTIRPPARVTLQELPGPGKGSRVTERLAAEPERTAWLVERLEHFRAEVLYERIALHSAAGSAAARVLGIPHVVELNAPLPEEAQRYRRLEYPDDARRLEREVLEHADLVVAVSPPLARYAKALGAPRVEVLPNAVALDRFRAKPRRHGDGPVAVLAGSLRPWHGVDAVVEAWSILGESAPKLVVVGDGPGRPLLEAVGAHVTGVVPHAAVADFLARADIGLAPYEIDAPDYFSPLKLFEYMAAGLAVVAGELPAVREVVSEETALLVPKGDPEALAAAVSGLSTDVVRRQRLGRAARKLVAEEHTWRHRARRVLAVADAGTSVGRELVTS